MKGYVLIAFIGGGLGIVMLFLAFSFLTIFPPAEKYAIYVNPIMLKGSTGIETHVELKNTGADRLTNVTVYYGGSARPDTIPALDPGQRVFLSPSAGGDLKEGRVTADHGIDVVKPYIIPANAPLFGNSGFGG